MTERMLPVLPLRDMVVFPGTPSSLIVGRARSISAVTAAMRAGGEVLLLTQKRSDKEQPDWSDLHDVGTIARVAQVLALPNGHSRVLVEGVRRARVVKVEPNNDHAMARVQEDLAPVVTGEAVTTLVRSVKGAVERYVKLDRAAPPDMLMGVNAIDDPSRLADMLVGVLKLTVEERQSLLATFDVEERLERVYKALSHEVEFLQVERKLRSRVKRERENTERESWIDDQVRAMQKEGQPPNEARDELEELGKQLAAKGLPEEVRVRAERELKRLSQMNPMSAEATVVRVWLDWVVALPWSEAAVLPTSLAGATEILDAAHYGLTTVKERILEQLAVSQLAPEAAAPILCLVGPPGVGKTSIARSMAAATGRPFVRVALGGVRDEAEIRGHRRTYVGALPGRLLQAMKRAGATNPLILLDEVDKMSSDMRGDPAAALLEVLDPEQNRAFNDHYLDLDYDLSKVLFVTTANHVGGIPHPLLDRLEVLPLAGYTDTEKVQIARRHLIPKQRALAGLSEAQLQLDDPTLLAIVHHWTRESGVRELERQLARVARRVARKVVEDGDQAQTAVTIDLLEGWLGPQRHDISRREADDHVGVVRGLSVSGVGGELLAIEVAAIPGKGKLQTTGRPGEVLKESAAAMFTYVRSRAAALGLDPDFHDTHDFHIHYPGLPGGVEGPSAGIAMATAMVSALTGIPVRRDTAMTGEISLRGRVLPVGGIKEKVLAAYRGGMSRVLLPERNLKDLHDVPDEVKEALEIVGVSHMDRVLAEALTSAPVARAAWQEPDADAPGVP